MSSDEANLVWKALADPTRRRILDLLRDRERTTGELVEAFPKLGRTGVMKHLDLLEASGLLLVRREGRHRWNHLNPVPLQQICERWLSPYASQMAGRATRLKHIAEHAVKKKKPE